MKTRFLYPFTIFLGAFLLFQVQPLIAKHLLPWFGGVPTVWTTCMLCFQAMLLLGYGYAHFLVARMKMRGQATLHMAVLGASLLVMSGLVFAWGVPILPGPEWKPVGVEAPGARIVLLIIVSVGLPFVLLSATGPLLQSWFSLACPARSPYLLYALSNSGSLVALLSYPFVIEPLLTLNQQAMLWSGGYVVYAIGCAVCAWQAVGTTGSWPLTESAADGSDLAGSSSFGRRLFWVGLPAVSCVMLLATTNLICQEIAVIPFLWILPLSLYLLSFVLCFAGERWYRSAAGLVASTVAVALGCWLLRKGPHISVWMRTFGFSSILFVFCVVCHGELYRLRPAPRRLTLFYGMIALGGVVGGVLVALVAPAVFTGPWEYHTGLLLCAVATVAVMAADPDSRFRRFPMVRWVLLGSLPVLAAVLVKTVNDTQRYGVFASRSFYGTLRVEEKDRLRPDRHMFKLYNGATLHGFQFAHGAKRPEPVSYYSPGSGIARALVAVRESRKDAPLRIGVIGLGIGTLAACGRTGDVVRFYEINPDVVAVAGGQGGFFSYIRDCAAKVQVVVGDARLSIEREVRQGLEAPLDILVVDAFSSDSIPVHLLTREAVGLYLQRLRPEGLLAFHISNRYFDLWPAVASVGRSFGLDSVLVKADKDDNLGYSVSVWVLVTQDRRLLAQPVIASGATRPPTPERTPLWTDQFSNLFQSLR